MPVKFENTAVFNIEGAMRGMVLPFKGTSDTSQDVIGENDYRIACKLVKAGFIDNAAHCKFLRQILLSVDISAPLYWWSEFDTYKVGTTADSESTMHTILKDSKTLSLENFEIDKPFSGYIDQQIKILKKIAEDKRFNQIEKLRWAKQVLPTSYIQKRHITMNYEVVRNMLKQRKNHRLQEWSKDFVDWVSFLPYNEFITGRGIIGEED